MFAIKPDVVWILIGLVLLIAEFGVPGLVVFFFGLGALVTGTACYFFDLSLNSQIICFMLSSVAMLVALRGTFARVFLGGTSDSTGTSSELDDIVGERARVVTAIEPGIDGRIEFHGTEWAAAANEALNIGSTVEVVGRDNLTLVVRRA